MVGVGEVEREVGATHRAGRHAVLVRLRRPQSLDHQRRLGEANRWYDVAVASALMPWVAAGWQVSRVPIG